MFYFMPDDVNDLMITMVNMRMRMIVFTDVRDANFRIFFFQL